LIFQISNNVYFPVYIAFEHENINAVTILTDEIGSKKHEIKIKLDYILSKSFGKHVKHKLIDVQEIFSKFFSAKNIEFDLTNSNNISRLEVKYITPGYKQFYVSHKISYLFNMENFVDKIKNTLSNVYEFYNIFDDVKSILNKLLITGAATTTNSTFIESDLSTFTSMFNYFDDKFYSIYDSIDNETVIEFHNELKNIDASNINNTLTIKGVRFYPDKSNTVFIYIPILNNYSMYFNEYKFAYAWAKRFNKLDNVYSYVNKIRLLSL
jgi:hypothetical protein